MRHAQYLLLLVAVAAACASEEPPGEAAAAAAVTRIDSASAPTDSAAFDWAAHLGRVSRDADRVLCLVTVRGAVSAGDSLWLVSAAFDSQEVEQAVAGTSGACGAFHRALEEVFPVTLLSSFAEIPPVSIAVLGYDDPVRVRDGLAVADLDQDGSPEFFGFCTSMEGVHLTVWTGPVAEGIRRWHSYHPLNYDVEPSCTEAETRRPYD